MKPRQRLGQWGEGLAARYVERLGCTILARNWRCPAGEVDLVVCEGTSLAFVEVRTRRPSAYGSPEESITAAKLAHMLAVAQTYVYEQAWEGDWRLDVVAIEVGRKGPPSIEWYRNVSI
jgi:putative endonuclease